MHFKAKAAGAFSVRPTFSLDAGVSDRPKRAHAALISFALNCAEAWQLPIWIVRTDGATGVAGVAAAPTVVCCCCAVAACPAAVSVAPSTCGGAGSVAASTPVCGT
eukprot:1485860-Alexandrium_andersonii.AAC.1